jgi:O-antigen ligase
MATIALVPPAKDRMDTFLLGATIMTFAAAFLTFSAGQMEAGRLTTGGMLDPNDLASLLAMVLPFGIAIGIDSKRAGALKRYALWGMVAGMAWILLLTGSRGGFVALFVGLAIMLARLNPKRSIIFLILLGVASPLIWKATPVEIQERLVSIGNLEEDYNLTDEFGRIATWKRGLGYIAEHPFTGLGWGNFQVAEGDRLAALGAVGPHYTAHNAYIQATAELGLLGGLLFLWMLFEAARRAFRWWKAGKPEYLASLGAFCAGAMFLSHAYSYTLYGLLGIIILSTRVLGKGTPERRRPKSRIHPALRGKRPLMPQGPVLQSQQRPR